MRQVRTRVSHQENGRGGKPRVRSTYSRGEGRAQRKPDPGARAVLGGRGTELVRRWPMLALTLFLLAAGAIVGLFAGGHVARAVSAIQDAIIAPFNEAGFSVREIELNGQEKTDRDAALAAIGIAKGGSIFGTSPEAARARLLMLPWVAEAEVRRRLPDTISVRLIEKRAFALWRNGPLVSVIERSGAVITGVNAESYGRLPTVLGTGAPTAAAPIIDVLQDQKAVSARVQSLTRVGERRWDILLAGGVTVKLPEEGWERELKELERLIVERGVLERDIEMIDLRFPDNYVFRLHNGDSRPVPRERHA